MTPMSLHLQRDLLEMCVSDCQHAFTLEGVFGCVDTSGSSIVLRRRLLVVCCAVLTPSQERNGEQSIVPRPCEERANLRAVHSVQSTLK